MILKLRLWNLIPKRTARVGKGQRVVNEEATGLRGFLERSCWKEAVLLDAFDDKRRYLGAVEMPDGFSALHPAIAQPRPFIRDDMMIAAIEDRTGTTLVKRYRLVVPS